VTEHIYKCVFVGSLFKYVALLNAWIWNIKCSGSTNVFITVFSVVALVTELLRKVVC
jgi:hypothetical protein